MWHLPEACLPVLRVRNVTETASIGRLVWHGTEYS